MLVCNSDRNVTYCIVLNIVLYKCDTSGPVIPDPMTTSIYEPKQ